VSNEERMGRSGIKVLEKHGEKQRESPLTIRDGGISQFDVPMGTGGTTSKYISLDIRSFKN